MLIFTLFRDHFFFSMTSTRSSEHAARVRIYVTSSLRRYVRHALCNRAQRDGAKRVNGSNTTAIRTLLLKRREHLMSAQCSSWTRFTKHFAWSPSGGSVALPFLDKTYSSLWFRINLNVLICYLINKMTG